MPTSLIAQPAPDPDGGLLRSIEDGINSVFAPVSDGLSPFVFAEITVGDVSFPWIVAWLVLAGTVFTGYVGFIQFRSTRLALGLVRGKYSRDDDPGQITHFQALSSALSGTVGLGNIAGVGVAVTIGGAGATFWMILAGLLGMCTKLVECTLGVRYREVHADGSVSGGPMHYLRKGVEERLPGAVGRSLGRVLRLVHIPRQQGSVDGGPVAGGTGDGVGVVARQGSGRSSGRSTTAGAGWGGTAENGSSGRGAASTPTPHPEPTAATTTAARTNR